VYFVIEPLEVINVKSITLGVKYENILILTTGNFFSFEVCRSSWYRDGCLKRSQKSSFHIRRNPAAA